MTEITDVPVSGTPARITSSFARGGLPVPPLVFVHGIALNGTAGAGITRFFEARGHSVVTFDLPGHGGSDLLPDDQVSMARFGALLWEVLGNWGLEGPVVACGHSAGGMTVLEAALQRPERIAAMLLISTPDAQPIRANDEADLSPVVEMMLGDAERLFIERIRVDFGAQAVTAADTYTLGMRHTGASGVRQVFKAAESYDVRETMARLSMPTLLARGLDDLVVNAATVARMHGRLRRSRMAVAPGGHSWFLQDPKALRTCLEEHYDFLMSAGPGGFAAGPASGATGLFASGGGTS